MRKIFVCLLFFFGSLNAFTQKMYFMYVQTEAAQPFFAIINGKTCTSSPSGYLILSKLFDTTYNISIGFVGDNGPLQNFSMQVNHKDHGYLLKNFAEKGWGLFDLQTLAVQMAVSAADKAEGKENTENNKVSPFTDMLSKATDDPLLKEKPLPEKTAEKITAPGQAENASKEISKELIKDSAVSGPVEKPVQAELRKEETEISNKERPAEEAAEIKAAGAESYKPSVVTKKSESSTTEGLGLVFIDDQGKGVVDTIRLLIPEPGPGAAIKEEPKEEKKFLDIQPDSAVFNTPVVAEKNSIDQVTDSLQVKKMAEDEKKVVDNSTDTISRKEEKAEEPVLVVKENSPGEALVKNHCPAVAEESDFFRLRKNMAAEEGDEKMLDEAKKYFRKKCFSTEQIRNLGLLFLNDSGKYRFFDLAYSYVTDTEKFGILRGEFKDEYYLNRFRAMLRN